MTNRATAAIIVTIVVTNVAVAGFVHYSAGTPAASTTPRDAIREEIRALRAEFREEIRALRAEFREDEGP